MSLNVGELTRDDVMALGGMGLKTDRAMEEALGRLRPVDTSTGAALGGNYRLGKLSLPPPHLGSMPLLEAISSPFIDPEATEYTFTDVACTLYVLKHGAAAVEPVFGILRRQRAVQALEKTAQESPEHFRAYLDKLDEITAPWAAFEALAMAWWDENAAEIGLADMTGLLHDALNDAFAAMELLPTGDDGAKKKRRSTPFGLRACWRWFVRCLGCLRRPQPGESR